jgi:outer membrane protein OmpA-like peptidoglycan-associated protein
MAISDTDLTQASLVAGLGVLPNVEFSIQVPYIDFQIDQAQEDRDFQKIGNIRLTPKFRLFQEGNGMPFSLGFLGSVALPTGSDSLPAALDRNTLLNQDVSWAVMGIVDKNLFDLPGGIPAVLTLNLGGLFPGKPDVFRLDRQTQPVASQLRRKGFPNSGVKDAALQYGAGLKIPLLLSGIGRLDQMTELRGNTGTIKDVDSYRALITGLRYMLTNGWALQAGVDFGLSNSVDDYSVFGGVSWAGPQPPLPEPEPVEKVVYGDRVIQVEKVSLSDMTFELDKAVLTDVGRRRVYLIAQKLRDGKSVKVEIQGATNDLGIEEHNRELGLSRSETVKGELTRIGIDPSQISTTRQGEEEPLSDQETLANRRVEFVVESAVESTSDSR